MSNSTLTLNRRDLIKSGGALVIGFSLSANLSKDAKAQTTQNPVAGPPDADQIDSWIAIHEDNTATVYIGFAELGQGCSTVLLQVAAEELDLSMQQVSTVGLDTHVTPNQGGTYSSSAIRVGRPQIQKAAAEARQALLKMAEDYLQVSANSLLVDSGIISGTGDDNVYTSYGELIGRLQGQRFNLEFTGNAPVKDPLDYRIVAQSPPRNDIPLKAKGTYRYMQHQQLPGMLHGRIIRPRGQGAYKDGVQVINVNEDSIAGIPSAKVLRRNNFIAVVADKEWDAVRAAQQLEVEWLQPENLPGNEHLFQQMETGLTNDSSPVDEGDVSVFENAEFTTEFEGTGPYQAHAPYGPNCALADVKQDSALVMCSTQDVYNTRSTIANVLGLEQTQVRVQYHEGSGTYGHSCWDDVAQAAAITSQLAQAPVRIQLMRWDEHGWDTYGPAHVGKARAAANSTGKIISYEYEGWQSHWSLIETSAQQAMGIDAAEWPAFSAQQINPRTLGGMYDIPNQKLINHHVPGVDYLKTAWLRSPMDLSCAFISEQAIDDLAYQLDRDPYEFRRQNITEYHWLGVLDAAAEAANWQIRPARQALNDTDELVQGRGIGIGTHLSSWGSAVAEIEVNRKNGKVRVLHLYGALDAGLVVNPGNVENQIMGQLVQTVSRMLFEEVTFNNTNVTSLDWNSYPMLRFEDTPKVTPIIVQRLDEPSSGAGEEVMAAAASAIANAFFDATGKRMAMYPFTPERVLDALLKSE